MWVGGFNLLSLFAGTSWNSLTCVLFFATIFLIAIKAFQCSGGIPLTICTDEFENIFSPSSYFHTKHQSNIFYLILDTCFTYSLVHTLVMSCWWSMWELENRFILFPCEITVKDVKAWDSVIISYFLVFVVVAFSYPGDENNMGEERIISETVTNNFLAFLSFV